MLSTITLITSTLALNLTAMPAQPRTQTEDRSATATPSASKPQSNTRNPLLGGTLLDIILGLDVDVDVDVELGDCLGVDIGIGANCGILVGVNAALECNPLSVEAACMAELGDDCSVEAFVDCTAKLTAHCQAEVKAGGALFCDGHFIGADTCLGDIDVDVNIDADACVDVDLGGDVDLELDADVCLDLDLDLNADCSVCLGAECHANCDPASVEATCEAELDGSDDELHAYAACQAELMLQCHANCDAEGSLFCEGSIYAGAALCLDVGIDIGL